MKCIIVIPVYKESISDIEELSLRRLIKTIDGNRPIVVVTHKSVCLNAYSAIFQEYARDFSVSLFRKGYFDGVKGYSKLLLSEAFYRRFSAYAFMLVYQLDAYIFRDELDYWCARGFDYIGAPFVTLFRKESSPDSDGLRAWGVGNGGFSLRKIDAFLSAFSRKGRVFSLADYYHNTVFRRNRAYTFLKKVCYTPNYLYLWAFRNSVARYIESSKVSEDVFWCFAFNGKALRCVLPELSIERLFLRTSKYRGKEFLRIALLEEALSFAFDEAPAHCLKLSSGRIPMGCHAFNKQLAFWTEHISELQKE